MFKEAQEGKVEELWRKWKNTRSEEEKASAGVAEPKKTAREQQVGTICFWEPGRSLQDKQVECLEYRRGIGELMES